MRQVRVILASASPRREELLRQIGIVPEIIPADIEEIVTSLEPDRVVMELSAQKAEHTKERIVREMGQNNHKNEEAEDHPVVVIGADTVVYAGGKILGKPSDEAAASSMLRLLQGKSHHVYTGVTLIYGDKKRTFATETKVDVYPMTGQEIENYVACGESMDKAGAYGIQGRFAAYIRGIEGSYTNVMGLPAGRVYQELKQLLEERDD